MIEKTKVLYSDFGAKGDGVTEDFAAIRAAHAYANQHKLPVFADAGATYYIGRTDGESIEIQTSTDWTDVTFIIDDRGITPDMKDRSAHVFKITSTHSRVRHEADSKLVKDILAEGGIKTDTKKLPYAKGYPVMLIPYDTAHKVYIRYGGNANNGQDQHEVMLIDGEGNIDKDTPALLDYNNISFIDELRVDDEPITLKGGLFHTRANCAPRAYTYYNRGMLICRSNVSIIGAKRKITDEGDTGAPYGAFFSAVNLNNLLLLDCTFHAHRYYFNEDPKTGGPTPMGTYEISSNNANDIRYVNSRQTNFYDKETGLPSCRFFDEDGKLVEGAEGVWGVMGSNYSKNLSFDGCCLNRFDAHAGVYNATLKNSDIIHVCLIGGGTALIEKCRVFSNNFMILRSDYGSFWNGEIIIKDSEFHPSDDEPSVVNGVWYNHDFGYRTSLPSMVFDNFKVMNETNSANLYSNYNYYSEGVDFSLLSYEKDGECVENKNPMALPKYIKVRNSGDLKFVLRDGWMKDKIKVTYE